MLIQWPVCCCMVLFSLIAYSLELSAQTPKACRSVHLWYSVDQPSQPAETNLFYNEITVEKSAPGTYFMACGFQMGYFGIQQLANGKKVVLFSVWEPGRGNDPNATPEQRRVKAMKVGNNVRVKRFGGEGTGGASPSTITTGKWVKRAGSPCSPSRPASGHSLPVIFTCHRKTAGSTWPRSRHWPAGICCEACTRL